MPMSSAFGIFAFVAPLFIFAGFVIFIVSIIRNAAKVPQSGQPTGNALLETTDADPTLCDCTTGSNVAGVSNTPSLHKIEHITSGVEDDVGGA